MRFLNKYKIHEKFNSSPKKLSLRVLKFNRPKWNFIKKKLSLPKLQKFPNVLIKEILLKVIIRLKRYHKTKLDLRHYISSLFDSSIKFNRFKTSKLKKDLISLYLIKPLYRIDLLLWYLDYFSSSFEAGQNINSKVVLVNEECVKSNYFLKKGDVISFNINRKSKYINSFVNLSQKHLSNNMYFSFLELDYYSDNIVIVKDFKELSSDDLRLLIEKNIDIKHLSNK